MIKKIFESTLVMGTSSIFVMGLDLVRVKILALLLGPEGIGTLSILNNFYTLTFTLISLGLGSGIVKYVSCYNNENNEKAIQTVVSNAFQIVLLFSTAALIITILFRDNISYWIFADTKYSNFLIIYTTSILIAAYPNITGNFLQGLKKIKTIATINVLRSLFSLALIIPTVYYFRLNGAVISVIIITATHFALNAYFVKRENRTFKVIVLQAFNSRHLKNILQYGLTSLLVGASYYLSHLLLKIIIVKSLGVSMNGIYQPAWVLTMTYPTVVLSSMSVYSYARLCELDSNHEIINELNGFLRVAVLIITPILFILLVARKPIIQILYSNDFILAAELVPIQILGSYFKVLFWSLGVYLLPSKRLFLFSISNILNDLLLIFFGFILIKNFKLQGIAIAFFLSYLSSTIFLYIFSKKIISLKLWSENRFLLAKSFFVLLIIIMVEKYCNLVTRSFISTSSIVAWFVFSLKKQEYYQLKEYVNNIFDRRFRINNRKS